MRFESTRKTLQVLHAELCTAVRREEGHWYEMASDYQSKYAFSSDYDKEFKHSYYDKATYCRGIAEQLGTLSPPSVPEEIASFIDAVKAAVAGCPPHPKGREQLDSLVAKMEAAASTGNQP